MKTATKRFSAIVSLSALAAPLAAASPQMRNAAADEISIINDEIAELRAQRTALLNGLLPDMVEDPFTISCEVRPHVGDGEYQTHRATLTGTSYSNGTRVMWTIDRYKLSSSSGPGSKSNINMSGDGWGKDSADAMINDGQWHDLNLYTWHHTSGVSRMKAEVVFDVAVLGDPSCVTNWVSSSGS